MAVTKAAFSLTSDIREKYSPERMREWRDIKHKANMRTEAHRRTMAAWHNSHKPGEPLPCDDPRTGWRRRKKKR